MDKKTLVMDIERKNEAAKNATRRLQKFHELKTEYKKKERK